jgi:hypothetical protein
MIILPVVMNEMIRKWWPAAVILVVLSCAGKQVTPPGVLSRDEMVKILSEVLVTEDKVGRLAVSSDSAYKVFDVLRGKMFDKAGVSDSVFRNSMNYYIDHPKEMQQIYTVLVDSLNLREQRESVRAEKK